MSKNNNKWINAELTVNWPQPWCPLHAPKLLWSRLIKAKVGHKPEQSRPKWDGTGLSVLFEKRMLHLWLVALCVHVVMWSSIRPSSHRYHGNSATHAQCLFPGSRPETVCVEHMALILVILGGFFSCRGYSLLCSVSYCLSPAVAEMDP